MKSPQRGTSADLQCIARPLWSRPKRYHYSYLTNASQFPEEFKNGITLISWALSWQVGLLAAICLFAKATSRIYDAIPNAKPIL